MKRQRRTVLNVVAYINILFGTLIKNQPLNARCTIPPQPST
uniref:Uncharacterized protein n=1 Tax=Anguilla anguilla TaxID=7936 RepID=A0A0E9W6M5_ANGAN